MKQEQAARPPTAQAQAGSPSIWYRNWVLLVFTLVSTLGFLDRIIIQVLVQPIKLDLHVSDAQMGLLGGLTFAVLYSLLSIPIARLAEHRHRMTIITIGTVLWSFATAISGFAASFSQLIIARIAVGIGEAAGGPAGSSVIADYFPPNRRASAMAISSLAIPAGAVLGGSLGGLIAMQWGWRAAFMCAGLPGLALALVQALTIREPTRGRYDEHFDPAAKAPPFTAVLGRMIARRSLFHMIVGATLSTIAGYGLNYFLAAYFTRRFGLTYAQAGLITGLVSGLPAALSIAAGGFLADRVARFDPKWYALIPAIGAGLAAPFYMASFAVSSWMIATGLLVVTAMCQYAYIPAAASLTQNMMQPRMRASAVAITGIIYSLLGQGLGPLFLGALSDFFAKRSIAGDFATQCAGPLETASPLCMRAEAQGLTIAMIVFPLLYAWSAVHLAIASRNIAKDLANP